MEKNVGSRGETERYKKWRENRRLDGLEAMIGTEMK
jgi:hypothetical protein